MQIASNISRLISIMLIVLCVYVCTQIYHYLYYSESTLPRVLPSLEGPQKQNHHSVEVIVAANMFGEIKDFSEAEVAEKKPEINNISILGILSAKQGVNVAVLKSQENQGVFMRGDSLASIGRKDSTLVDVNIDSIKIRRFGIEETLVYKSPNGFDFLKSNSPSFDLSEAGFLKSGLKK